MQFVTAGLRGVLSQVRLDESGNAGVLVGCGGRVDPHREHTARIMKPSGIQLHAQRRSAVDGGQAVGDTARLRALAGPQRLARVLHGTMGDRELDLALRVGEHHVPGTVHNSSDPGELKREHPRRGSSGIMQDQGLLDAAGQRVVLHVGGLRGTRVGDRAALDDRLDRTRALQP